MKKLLILFLFSFLFTSCGERVNSDSRKPNKLYTASSGGYSHDRWVTEPKDQYGEFIAYTVSMDGHDDGGLTGVPEFVSYHIKRSPPLGKGPRRPSKWFETPDLDPYTPHDNSYKNSGYSRGHMCMKYIAWRMGKEADRETHNTANACPQIQAFNAGIWLDMENKTGQWADKYGDVWVVCGPAFSEGRRIDYIGDPGEMKVAIPHYYWKIVTRVDEGGIHTMAFCYPHKDIDKVNGKWDHLKYATSIDSIESMTGLNFFSVYGEQDNRESLVIETVTVDKIWNTK